MVETKKSTRENAKDLKNIDLNDKSTAKKAKEKLLNKFEDALKKSIDIFDVNKEKETKKKKKGKAAEKEAKIAAQKEASKKASEEAKAKKPKKKGNLKFLPKGAKIKGAEQEDD